VEKAHPDVFNVLLQLLDDGRVTDSQARARVALTLTPIQTQTFWSHKSALVTLTGNSTCPAPMADAHVASEVW
jgi:MoxR-like ATPase